MIEAVLGITKTRLIEAFQYQSSLEKELGIPVLLPLQEGVGKLMPILKNLIKS